MPNKVAKTKDPDDIAIQEIEMSLVRVNLLGKSPLVIHAVSAKNKGALLFPPPKKNAAEKASTMKHEPFEEFREAAYRFTDADKMPTRLFMPAGSIHGAMANAAIDLVGARKAQIGRLTTVEGVKLAVYGIPQIWSTIVRSSDMARTPDVRTLPILPEWAIPNVDIAFVGSLIKQQSIANLLGAAGNIVGIGDGRPEKGKLTFGKFQIVGDDHPDLMRIVKTGGRAAQDAALQNPGYYDLETEALLEWFKAERGRRAAAPAQSPRKKQTQSDLPDLQYTDPVVGKALKKSAKKIQAAVNAERAVRNGRRRPSART